jgi:phosphate transport system substrate-binding protein
LIHFRWLAVAALMAPAAIAPALAVDVSGAGATFPSPIYAAWAEAYKKETGIAVNYRAIGSGDGIQQIQNREVTFGASDMPLKAEELERYGLVQFPTVMGGIVAVFNVDGVKTGELTLDGPTLARIFLGEIKSWNDAALRKLNPNTKLPSQPIVVVHRSDGSGTTFAFSDYLTKVSPDWKSKVGSITRLDWPTGVGAGGNDGVAATVARTKGAIGYIEYAHVRPRGLTYARLVNRDGKVVAPALASFAAAASGADWEGTPNFGVILTNQPGAQAWPITSASFVLMHRQPADPAAAREVLRFFAWAYAKGGKLAEELGYVPMPANVVAAVQKLWASDIKDAGGKAIFAGSR